VDSLVNLARQSEILVVGIPPTPKTQAIINREVLYALPKGSLLVLVTRMAVVEQEALWQRLEDNEIRAAIDVFAPEPPPADAWFRRHVNVLPTPHIAGGTDYCHRRCFTDACLDTVAVLTGGTPRYQASLRDHKLYQGELTGKLNA
jgi:phosphoglycerate dehydrogenase-like enzyme